MDHNGPKYDYLDDNRRSGWHRHEARFAKLLNPAVQYYSAFITRPDSAPWINTADFASLFALLLRGKRCTVISEPGNSILLVSLMAAEFTRHVPCPREQAYLVIDDLFNAAIARKTDIVLISCGPTATCLAHRLAVRGVHSVDIGSAGGFLHKLMRTAR